MLSLPLSKLPGGGLSSGAVVHVDDESQAFKVDMVLIHQVRQLLAILRADVLEVNVSACSNSNAVKMTL
jgi:hypothetical protein